MKPRSWLLIPLPEHHPETWADLPGYAEAAEKVRQGQKLFPVAPSPVTTPRRHRSLESLTTERDQLVRQRDTLTGNPLPDDPGALSGIRRKSTNADRKQDTVTDKQLEKFATLTRRIEYLNHRIRNHP